MACLEPSHQRPRRPHRRSPIRAQTPMPAIMHHHIRRRAASLQPLDLRREPFLNSHRRRLPPIVRHCIPQHRNHPQRPRRPQHIRPPRAKRWTKKAHRRSRDLLQRLTRPRQLLAHPSRPRHRQVRMTPAMVADQVPGLGDLPHQPRLSLGKSPYQEKRRPHLVLSQPIQQPWRPCRIRSIVKRHRNLARPPRRNQSWSKNLRRRPTRRIGEAARRQAQRGSPTHPRVNPARQRRQHRVYQCAAQPRSTASCCRSCTGHPILLTI